MKEEKKYSRLLSIKQTKDLFLKIETVYRTKIDLKNSGFDLTALKNALNLLVEIEFIDIQNDYFVKKKNIEDKSFEIELAKALENKLAVSIEDMFACKKHFDNETNGFFLYRNEIKSRYLGLLMILGDLNIVDVLDNKIYFSESNSLSRRILKKTISKKQLDRILELEEKFGEEAEQIVMKYEMEKLAEKGICKQPIQVSQIDVSAGFDILSFFSDAENDKKYIEVKSCDNEFKFYVSANEINKASLYGCRYYLYLYNRVSKAIKEICNPYDTIFTGNNYQWDMIPQIYKIRYRQKVES